MRYFHIFVLLLFLAYSPLYAQKNTIQFRHMDKAIGLDQPFPFHMIQDSKGYIWIAGENGLWRYSGSQFKHYYHNPIDSNSLAYDFIWRLLEDKNENIWAGTYGGGLSKFNPRTNIFTNYVYEEGNNSSISNNNVRGLEEDADGNIWVGTNKGLNRLNPKTETFKRLGIEDGLSSLVIRDLKLSRDKKLLFVATAGGLNILDLETNKIKVIDTSLPKGYRLNYNYVYDIFEINRNKVMVATGRGLHFLDLDNYNVNLLPYNNGTNGPSSSVVFSIKSDPSDSNILWLATMNGINRYDIAKNQFIKIKGIQKDENNIGGRNIYNVLKDRNGGLWAAVNNAGIYYNHPSFNKFQTENFLTGNVEKYLNRYTDFLRANENELLITTYSGLVVWNDKTGAKDFYQVPDINNFDINRLTSITHLEGNKFLVSVWGKFAYLWDHDQKELKSLQEDSKFENITFNTTVLKDSKNRIWLGNRDQGLFLYEPKTNKVSSFPVSDPNQLENSGDEHIKYLFEDSKNRFWVGTTDGLHLYNEDSRSFTKYAPGKNEKSLSNGTINHISESEKGGLWVSTALGLCYFDVENETFKTYFKEDGLPANVISGALEDKNGDLWIATASGLSRMQKNGSFSNYDRSDGLSDEYFVAGSAYEDEQLGLLFGTSTEVLMVNPATIVFNNSSPEIRLENLMINNQKITPANRPDVLQKAVSKAKRITLQQSDYLVNISFDALNLVNGHKNMYSVFLQGFDKEWRPASSERSISFSQLPAGEYKLLIKASNDEQVWSKAQAGITVEVLPFWYNSNWFRTVLSISILSITALIIYGRFNSINKVKRKLENTVKDRTKEVLAQKEEIESQNEVLLSRNNKIELLLRELNHRIKNNLQLISSILNLHSRSTDNIDAKMALTEGKLRMQALSLLHQKLYMTEKYTEVDCKEYIQELIDYLSIAFKSNYSNVKFNLDLDDFKLNLDQAVPLGLVLNELVTNSLKHSGKDDLIIDFKLKKTSEVIKITLKDNGQGISKSQFEKSSSFGINIIKSLIDQLNGQISVECDDGNHFKIEFVIKEPKQ